MRIIGGALGGRRFEPPAGIPARPTTDRAREGLFNILANLLDLDGVAALDVFAGTGGVSYELLSRGAASVVAVEKDEKSCRFIEKTAAAFGVQGALRIVRADVFRLLASSRQPFGFVFADPPYALPQMTALPDLLLAPTVCAPEGIVVLEHSTRTGFEGHSRRFREAVYGDSAFSFFRPE